MSTVHYTQCPVCGSSSIHPLLSVKDHSVSGEAFVVWQCSQCALRFTQDVPDEGSIARYYQSADYISHSNSDKGFLNKMYQRVRGITLGQKAALVIKHTRVEGNLLDIGAGIGAFVNEMKQRRWQVTGAEPDAGARQKASSLFGLQLLTDIDGAGLHGQRFDAITLWHVLEHVHPLHVYIEKLKMLLTPDGKLFIAVPNYQSLDAELYGNYWAAYDVPRHLYHFAPTSIHSLVGQHGLKVIAEKPMWFDAFYISLLSSKYRKGKTSWLPAGVHAVRSNLKALTNRRYCSSIIYIIAKN
jgi:SAM-dependent methyltransferase